MDGHLLLPLLLVPSDRNWEGRRHFSYPYNRDHQNLSSPYNIKDHKLSIFVRSEFYLSQCVFFVLPFIFYLFVWVLSFILVQWLTPSPRGTTMSYVNRGFRDERRVICDVWCVRCLNTLNTGLATVTLCYNHTALWQFITLGNLITGIRHTPTAEIQMDKITNV